MKAVTHLLLAGLAFATLSACNHIHDPWARGNQFASERERTAAQAQALRQRLLSVQTDR